MSESSELTALRATVRGFASALVGYSGGVDSALLAVVLRQELGRERMLAGGGRSAPYPAAPGATARAGGQRLGIPLGRPAPAEPRDSAHSPDPNSPCFLCRN